MHGVLKCMFQKKQGKFSNKSILMSYDLQKGLKKNLGFVSRGVKFANFQVLRETVNECKSLLLELGFLSNYDENSYIGQKRKMQVLALLIIKELFRKKIRG